MSSHPSGSPSFTGAANYDFGQSCISTSANFDFRPNCPNSSDRTPAIGEAKGGVPKGEESTAFRDCSVSHSRFRSITLPHREVSGVFPRGIFGGVFEAQGDRTRASRVCCSTKLGKGEVRSEAFCCLEKDHEEIGEVSIKSKVRREKQNRSLPKIFRYVGTSTKLTMIVLVRCAENAQTPSTQRHGCTVTVLTE